MEEECRANLRNGSIVKKKGGQGYAAVGERLIRTKLRERLIAE